MKYGCIGEHLGHSFSKEIHAALADYEYELKEIPKDKLADFAAAKDFIAVNVTIPYKEAIIPYLSEIDGSARQIGAVNTVVNRGGELYGYNTDFYGMSELIRYAGIEIFGKKVIILGTGGTSKTAYAVASALGARELHKVSRTGSDGALSYDMLYECHSDAEIIINTTPLGMFPKADTCAVDISKFTRLSGVIDAVYNPLRTKLISDARERSIPAMGGLYMLVAQAVRASEIFLGISYEDGIQDKVYEKILQSKENTVLIGMPASGKSTVGKIIADITGSSFFDTDDLIKERTGMEIPEIFSALGEGGFRDIESSVINELSSVTGAVIATGGGAVLRYENVNALKQNGRIYFIDRPLSALLPTEDRPLASTPEAIRARYLERYDIYKGCADFTVDAVGTADEAARLILEEKHKF